MLYKLSDDKFIVLVVDTVQMTASHQVSILLKRSTIQKL